ncbi:uncharacterized protein SPSK_00900 [Sporothrix schenckii 1099-18]|uniref:Uncharacterized protein n=1 Tax=Sporothrix schenckii 1099-18 TaxID=1397361 RepID=A0A0F2LYQ9_SPOSC|nr:uncharacterized protein SPSK_00900 [Sporothrix schenckii 1099-18]KJR81635.1 hypothetical protein SPSK_00900 [Sporothrix schenckii 1099-18]
MVNRMRPTLDECTDNLYAIAARIPQDSALARHILWVSYRVKKAIDDKKPRSQAPFVKSIRSIPSRSQGLKSSDIGDYIAALVYGDDRIQQDCRRIIDGYNDPRFKIPDTPCENPVTFNIINPPRLDGLPRERVADPRAPVSLPQGPDLAEADVQQAIREAALTDRRLFGANGDFDVTVPLLRYLHDISVGITSPIESISAAAAWPKDSIRS